VAGQSLQKAFIVEKEGGAQLSCRFNPREYTITKSSKWTKTPAKGAKSAPKQEFLGAQPRSMQMELFFDAWESKSASVAKDVDTLLGWTNPTQKSISANKPNPPIVVFHWGTTASFDAFIKQVTAKFTLFQPDGTPLRATVGVSFEEVPAEQSPQNPTSGGSAGRRTHVLCAGETLPLIAYREYGDPALWRAIALENNVDDPLRIPLGHRLQLPPIDRAEELV
jgi:nucleoid-associated protein YgaU